MILSLGSIGIALLGSLMNACWFWPPMDPFGESAFISLWSFSFFSNSAFWLSSYYYRWNWYYKDKNLSCSLSFSSSASIFKCFKFSSKSKPCSSCLPCSWFYPSASSAVFSPSAPFLKPWLLRSLFVFAFELFAFILWLWSFFSRPYSKSNFLLCCYF